MKTVQRVKFLVGQSGKFGEKQAGAKITLDLKAAQTLKDRGIVEFVKSKKEVKDGV
jgi:hypothetical protein